MSGRADQGAEALLELLIYRPYGHSRSDPGKYRPAEEVDDWMTRDPLARLAIALDEETATGLTAQAEREMEAALDAARAHAACDPAQRATALKEPA